ncbi:uncharacterized protein LOC143202402 isoform X1 [Rhynchophorus ferrugineus]|uniref:uncharacterized protein LOC143202402 isoform X1 n=1 Tax=Rhynchophorus ferrugineus TaxID=354439 RepID=UPI003FCDBC88
MLFFCEKKFPRRTIEDFGSNKLSFALLLKRCHDALKGQIDEIVLQMVYGNSRQPPGDEKSPSLRLRKVEAEDDPDKVLLGVWAPPNCLCKASVLKLLFPGVCDPKKIPEVKEVPLHVAVAYDAFKARDVFELSTKYPGKVMSFGYFSSDIPGDAKLLAKTTDKFESRVLPVTYEEKIVIQLAKEDQDYFVEFEELGPSYMSRDVEIGELDCKYFFPADYNAPEAEIITYLKKKSKRRGKMAKVKIQQENVEETTQPANEEVGLAPTDANAEETTGGDDEAEAVNETEEDDEDDGSKDDDEDEDGVENIEEDDAALRTHIATNLEAGSIEVDLPSYTIVSGLPSYEEALEQLKKIKEMRPGPKQQEEASKPSPEPAAGSSLSVFNLFGIYNKTGDVVGLKPT